MDVVGERLAQGCVAALPALMRAVVWHFLARAPAGWA